MGRELRIRARLEMGGPPAEEDDNESIFSDDTDPGELIAKIADKVS